MYNITKLSEDTQKFLNYLGTGNRPRSAIASLAIAKVLANQLILASGEVDNIEQYYRTTSLIQVQQKLSNLNELVVLDYETILEYVKKFYILRYRTVNPPATICCINSASAVEDFFGLSIVVEPVVLAAMRDQPIELTKIHNGTAAFFAEISKELS